MGKNIKVTEDGFLLLQDFAEFLDLSKVAYYSMSRYEMGALKIKFYDKKKKLIKPKAQKSS